MSDTYESIALIITSTFNVPRARIAPDLTLGDLELDSLALLELAERLRETHAPALRDEDVSQARTLQDLAAIVARGAA